MISLSLQALMACLKQTRSMTKKQWLYHMPPVGISPYSLLEILWLAEVVGVLVAQS
jgi:hypothetical protein